MNIYEDPPLVPHGLADEALTAALEGREQALSPNSVLVGLALQDHDRVFVERWCNRIAHDSADLWATSPDASGIWSPNQSGSFASSPSVRTWTAESSPHWTT